jgi:hypothetical protein
MARIYLSSTYEDLVEHRRAVGQVLLQMEHLVIGMEGYAAADARPLDKCVKDAASVDVYVGIFALRYGHVPDGTGGVSITECEYRAASDSGVTRLVFLLRENHEWPTTANDVHHNAAAAVKVRALRERLTREHVTAFFTSPDNLAAAVAVAVAGNLELKRASANRAISRGLSEQLAQLTRYGLNQSFIGNIAPVLEAAERATVLELDFGASEWWSTRMQLVALIANDCTTIETIALLDRDRFFGTVGVRALRAKMREVHPEVDEAYARIRAQLPALKMPAAPRQVEAVLSGVLQELNDHFAVEPELRQIMSAEWVRASLGPLLSDERVSVPQGPLREIDLYDILKKPGRFVGMEREGQFEGVVDRHALAAQTTTALVREQLARP